MTVHVRQREQRAEVYAFCRGDYTRTNTWDRPSVVLLSDEDHFTGVHWRPCPDCCGTGHWPVPWDPATDPDPRCGPGSDFCVACKGQGLEPVMA